MDKYRDKVVKNAYGRPYNSNNSKWVSEWACTNVFSVLIATIILPCSCARRSATTNDARRGDSPTTSHNLYSTCSYYTHTFGQPVVFPSVISSRAGLRFAAGQRSLLASLLFFANIIIIIIIIIIAAVGNRRWISLFDCWAPASS